MVAQTPIKCFVRLGGLFFIEDYAGTRTPICMAADEDQADWLAYTMERAHHCPVKPWNYTDPEAKQEGTKLRPVSTSSTPDRVSVSCPPSCKCTAESGCLVIENPQPPVAILDLDALNAPWAGQNLTFDSRNPMANVVLDGDTAPDGATTDRPQ